jgi:hypothetical protein
MRSNGYSIWKGDLKIEFLRYFIKINKGVGDARYVRKEKMEGSALFLVTGTGQVFRAVTTLKMEAARSSETLASYHITARRHNLLWLRGCIQNFPD